MWLLRGYCLIQVAFKTGSSDISGSKLAWACEMGQWPMFYSFLLIYQNFDGQIENLKGLWEKRMALKIFNTLCYLEQN